jgi:hypothetical protein
MRPERCVVTISRAELSALLPWMSFNTDADGPCALAMSDSGRHAYIGVCDSTAAPDGQPGDAILRYDTYTDQLTLFHRVNSAGSTPRPAPHWRTSKAGYTLGMAPRSLPSMPG